MVTCTATFEPVADRDRERTHTCDLTRGHLHPHHCPGCGKSWTEAEALDWSMRRHPAGKKKGDPDAH